MIIYALSIVIVLLIVALWYIYYKFVALRDSIKNFSPIVSNTTNTILHIGKVDYFTKEEDLELSNNKDFLKKLLKKIHYRIASYTAVMNSAYKVTWYNWDQPMYSIKADSEKWLECGRMGGYTDIESDITHLLSLEQ